LAVTDAFLEYLGEGSRRELCRSLQRAIHAAAAEALPEQLPCGLNHGDFAPWNVLVDRGGRVQVIDTLGKWTAPIYEDLARFLFGVELSPQQIWTGGQLVGTAELQWIRHQFWSGYFGAEPVPVRAIRLFECQMTLERWVALEYASRTARRWRRWIKNARTWMWELYVRPQLRAAVREWEQPSPRETFQKDAHHACTN
jgi:aminoglycoside phosphotransferase (APT) family kinase protein